VQQLHYIKEPQAGKQTSVGLEPNRFMNEAFLHVKSAQSSRPFARHQLFSLSGRAGSVKALSFGYFLVKQKVKYKEVYRK
jgi:hypothetical protein